MSLESVHADYIRNVLLKEISEKLSAKKVLHVDIKHAGGLDGFMSALYTLSMKVIGEDSMEKTYELIAKFMKGDEAFRITSRSYIQFANEMLIYSKVIPYYSKVIGQVGGCSIKTDDWVPISFVAKYGKIEGLCCTENTTNESVLVVENLKHKNYRLGPPLYLDRNHLLAMFKPLASYHAMTYVLKIQKDPQLQRLIDQIIPLPFAEKGNNKNILYHVLYSLAFTRFFEYFERSKGGLISQDNVMDKKLEKSIQKLKERYGHSPTALLERIRTISDEDDEKFAAILHGDFNRNNVLFQYLSDNNIPDNAKMIDFQELRYGTPCIDLSFAMYMNMEPSIRDEFWMELLKHYHSTMLQTMSSVLKETSACSALYSFDEFYKHFTKKAFYGVMVCMHFLPWLCGTKEELHSISTWFERDMHSEEFRQLSLDIGGDAANKKIFDIVKHAHAMGHMEFI